MFTSRFRLLLSSVLSLSLCHVASLAQVQIGPSGATVEINGQVRFAEGGAPAENVLVRLESYVKDMQAGVHDYILMNMKLITEEEYAGMG